MNSLKRRDAVAIAAGLAINAGVLASAIAAPPNTTNAKAKDAALSSAHEDLAVFMFQEQQSIKLDGDGHSRDLIITSARDQDLRAVQIHVRSATMRVFRADTDKDEFTKKGGLYWSFNGKQGTVQFKQPGALIMVVRDQQDNVQFFTLVPDLRC